jgi:ribosome-binding protein aMBF1 (putative translation factor)
MFLVKTWDNVKKNIKSISEDEKRELELIAEIVSRLILAREGKGLSQKKLSEMIGIEKSTIGRMETLNTIPKLDTIVKIINALNLEICIKDKDLA